MEIQQVNLGQVAFNPKGSWNADVTYKRLNVVYYKGRSYYAKQENTNQPPSMDSDFWGLMVDGGDVTNNPDEEDVTSMMDEDGKSVIKFADRAYDPDRFSGKGYKILRKNMQNVRLAVVTINVTKAPTADGELSVTINSIDTHITLSATGHNTTELTAQAIADALTPEHEDYDIEVSGSTVKLTRKFGEDVPASAYDVAATGMELTVEDSVKTVRRNLITQIMINKPNTIYEIRYDFDLNGGEIQVPEGCTLKFEGGMLRNGTVKNLLHLSGRLNKVFDDIKVVDSDTNGFVPVNAFVTPKDTFSNFRCVEINEDLSIDGDLYLDAWQEIRGHNTNLSLNGTIFLGHSCKVGDLNINQRSTNDISTLCILLSHIKKTYAENKYKKIFRNYRSFTNLTIENITLSSDGKMFVGRGIAFSNDNSDTGFWGVTVRNIRVVSSFLYAISIENSLDSPKGWFTDLTFENIKIAGAYIGVYVIGKNIYGLTFDKISMQMSETNSYMFRLEGGTGVCTNIIPWDYVESNHAIYGINPNYIGRYVLDASDNHSSKGIIYDMLDELHETDKLLDVTFKFLNGEEGLQLSQVHVFKDMDESVRFKNKDFFSLPLNNIVSNSLNYNIVILKKLGLFNNVVLSDSDGLRIFFVVNKVFSSKVIELYILHSNIGSVYHYSTILTSIFSPDNDIYFHSNETILSNKQEAESCMNISDNSLFLKNNSLCMKNADKIYDAKGFYRLYNRDIVGKDELLSIMLQKSEKFKQQQYGYRFTYHDYDNTGKMYLSLMKSSVGNIVDSNGFGVVFLDDSFTDDEVESVFRFANNRTSSLIVFGTCDLHNKTITVSAKFLILGENCNINNGTIICNHTIVKSKTLNTTNCTFQGATYIDRSVSDIPSRVYNTSDLGNYKNKSFAVPVCDLSTNRTFFKNGSSWFDALGRPYNKSIMGATSERPTDVSEGFEYYDSTLKKKILWNGTDWVNMDGTSLE